MSKTAFIFPGQGAQYVSMGKDFYDTYKEAKEVYELASKVTGLDVEGLCFTENDNINITEYTQIAMLTTEVAILKVMEAKGLKADVTAGLSLGEYGALAAAGVMELSDLFHLIRKRGIFMQEAYPVGGAMTAVEKAAKTLSESGAKRCIPLKVSGPFHSALLNGAGELLSKELENVMVKKPQIPYVCNVDATFVTEESRIKELLQKQVSSSVCWQQSVENMIANGVDTFVEIGPGKTLTGFMRKINKDVKVYNVETINDLDKLLEEMAC